MHEIFEHTADLGIRIRAESLSDLFAEAGCALFELIVENFQDIQPKKKQVVVIRQESIDLMMFDWLNELLYLFDAQRLILRDFSVSIQGDTLNAEVTGEPWDESLHQLDHEVKAITYHELKVRQEADGSWLSEVILDI